MLGTRPGDLSTIEERTEDPSTQVRTQSHGAAMLTRTRSEEESYPSAVSQLTEASAGYEIPVMQQFGYQNGALGGLPNHLSEVEDEESYFTPPPPLSGMDRPAVSYGSYTGARPDLEGWSYGGGSAAVAPMASTPSVSQMLAPGNNHDPAIKKPSPPPAANKKKRFWPWMFGVALIVVVILGVVIGVVVAGGGGDSSERSAQAADGVGTPSENEDTPTMSPTIVNPDTSRTEAPTTPQKQVVLPELGEGGIGFTAQPASADQTMPPTPAPTTSPTSSSTAEGSGTGGGTGSEGDGSGLGPGEAYDCPEAPNPIPQSQTSDDSYLAVYGVNWYSYSEVGNCARHGDLKLHAFCQNGGTPFLISEIDLCEVFEDEIVCLDTPGIWEQVEMGCIGYDTTYFSDLVMEISVEDGSTVCYSDGENAYLNVMSVYCGQEATDITCPTDNSHPGDTYGGDPVCYAYGRCFVGENQQSCNMRYPGVTVETSAEDRCIEPFATSRGPGEPCFWDIECVSDVCVAGRCQYGKGCGDFACERDNHCQSGQCLFVSGEDTGLCSAP